MTRDQLRRFWLFLGVGVLFLASWTHGTVQNYLIRGSLAMLGGILFWEWMKDR